MKGFIIHIVYKEEDAEKCLESIRLWAYGLTIKDQPDCVLKFMHALRRELDNPRPIR